MTRLIDADELMKAIAEFPYGYRGMIESVIYNMPTVDAVPIDWMICKRNEHNNDGFAWIFEAVIDDWRKENETD